MRKNVITNNISEQVTKPEIGETDSVSDSI